MNLAFKLPNYNLCLVFFWSKSWSTITMIYSNISNGHKLACSHEHGMLDV